MISRPDNALLRAAIQADLRDLEAERNERRYLDWLARKERDDAELLDLARILDPVPMMLKEQAD